MKKLFYFPPSTSDLGTMPAFYDEVSADSVADAIAWGGIDVTDDIDASRAFEEQLRYADECAS